jgi:hypothetical protein
MKSRLIVLGLSVVAEEKSRFGLAERGPHLDARTETRWYPGSQSTGRLANSPSGVDSKSRVERVLGVGGTDPREHHVPKQEWPLKFRIASALLIVVSLAAPCAARADGKANDDRKVCTDAYGKAQTLRDDHKLRDAREQLRVCSQPTCKAFIVKDCTSWLLDVEARLPSIVLSAKDARGQALVDVTVSMDGTVVEPKLDGDSIEVDPGQHTFTFVASDGTKVEQSFAVLEGQKAQSVAAIVPTTASLSVAKAEQEAVRAPAKDEPRAAPARGASPQKTIGIVVGAVGLASVAVGAVFGLLAQSAKDSYEQQCGSNVGQPAGLCTYQGVQGHNDAATKAALSSGFFIGGAVAAAAGVVLFFTAPKGAPSAAVGLGPSGLVVRGDF